MRVENEVKFCCLTLNLRDFNKLLLREIEIVKD